MWTQGAARLAPSSPEGKPLSVTLSEVHSFQSQSVWQVQQVRWTEGLIKVGVISSSWHVYNNMAEIGERQNVWKEKLLAQHVCLQAGPCPWPQPLFNAPLCWFPDCVRAGMPIYVFCLCESACEWSVAIEPSLRCLISDRLDWSAQGECDIQLVLSCCKLAQ